MKPFEDAKIRPTSQTGVVLLQWQFQELPSGGMHPRYGLQMPAACAAQILRWRDREQNDGWLEYDDDS